MSIKRNHGAGPLLFLLLAACLPSQGQIIDCAATYSSDSYVVYLDELSIASASLKADQQLRVLMQQLKFTMGGFLEGVVTELGSASPCVVNFCEGRKPRNVSDFDRPLIQKMDNQGVILEVWGMLDKKTSSGINTAHANIYCLLVPVWIKTSGQQHQPGVQVVEYVSRGSGSLDENLDSLANKPQLRIFVEAGVGINKLLNKEYDDARTSICAALGHMDAYLASKGSVPSAKEQALVEYLKLAAKETIQQANKDPHYTGGLQLLDENAECHCKENGGRP